MKFILQTKNEYFCNRPNKRKQSMSHKRSICSDGDCNRVALSLISCLSFYVVCMGWCVEKIWNLGEIQILVVR